LWECQEKEAANIPGMNLIEAWRQVYNRKALLAAGGDSAGCGKWRMTKLIVG
jgi:hypothetical protein